MDAAVVYALHGVEKRFRAGEVEVVALRRIDLELRSGELVVLLGPSGSGKTTLLHLLGALDVPSAGSIRFRGRELAEADESERTQFRRNHVGFVFQHYQLLPSLTARENVALVTDIARDPMKPDEALGRVGLTDRVEHFPAQLSGGEQQRVAIARAIAKRPDVLLCDEPTGALDFATGRRVLAAIDEVNRTLGTTTVLITHNAPIAEMADRVIRLRSGEIVETRVNAQRARPEEIEW